MILKSLHDSHDNSNTMGSDTYTRINPKLSYGPHCEGFYDATYVFNCTMYNVYVPTLYSAL